MSQFGLQVMHRRLRLRQAALSAFPRGDLGGQGGLRHLQPICRLRIGRRRVSRCHRFARGGRTPIREPVSPALRRHARTVACGRGWRLFGRPLWPIGPVPASAASVIVRHPDQALAACVPRPLALDRSPMGRRRVVPALFWRFRSSVFRCQTRCSPGPCSVSSMVDLVTFVATLPIWLRANGSLRAILKVRLTPRLCKIRGLTRLVEHAHWIEP